MKVSQLDRLFKVHKCTGVSHIIKTPGNEMMNTFSAIQCFQWQQEENFQSSISFPGTMQIS
jgi:hypothetical protein